MINPSEPNQYHAHLNNRQEKTLALLLQILNSISDPIFVKDLQHKWIFLNDAFCDFIGYKREELIGKTDYDFFSKEEADVFWEKDEQVFVKNQPCENEDFFTDSFGITHIISTKKTLFIDDIGNKFLVGTIRDITNNVEKYQKTEATLKNAYAQMETLVTQRTQQLVQINLALQGEIADHKKTEQGLRASQQKLSLLIEQTPLAIIEWNSKLEVESWNPAAEEIFGYTKEEVIGCNIEILVPEHVKEHVKKVVDNLLTSRAGNCSVNENLTANGKIITCEWHNNPLVTRTGEIIGVVSIAIDISERKQLEAQRQRAEDVVRQALADTEQSKALLSLIIDATPDCIFAKDTNFRYILNNYSAACAIGSVPEEIFGKDDLEIGFSFEQVFGDAKKGIRGFRQDDIAVLQGKIIHNPFEVATTASGETYIFDTKKIPLRNKDGEIFAILGFAHDITHRVRAEEALKQSETQLRQQAKELKEALNTLQRAQIQLVQNEKMSSLGQIVAGIAHEINNPVSFIYGNLSYTSEYNQNLLKLLKLYQDNYPQPAKQIQDCIKDIDLEFLQKDIPLILDSMKMGAERIKQIVVSLRNFSRLDEAEMKTVNIHQGIDSTLMILQSRLNQQNRRPKIHVIKDYANLPLVECYPGQLNQVFMNLLVNAIDALEDSFVNNKIQDKEVLKITINTQQISQNSILISISDNGYGIPEQIQQKIFDPFFTTKSVGRGTGLGLSIAYQIIIEKHQGKLRCISNPGEGTEFQIEIPVGEAPVYLERARMPIPQEIIPQDMEN